MARVAHPAFDTERRQLFIVGNEAADVDSLVSAYAMAVLLESPQVQAIPLAQISREEFRLRGDALALFRTAGSEAAADGSPLRMRFWDEVDWDAVQGLSSRGLVLTDHNKMTRNVAEHFAGRVELILDHHSDTRSYPDAKSEIDEQLGSACTLALEQFLAKPADVPREIGILLAGVILLDTRNFDPKEGKGTPRDRDAMDRLAPHLPLEEGAWYNELMRARRDVSHLSVPELLMLDMKVASIGGFSGTVAWSAVMGTLEWTCAKAGGAEACLEACRSFAGERGHKALIANFSAGSDGNKALVVVPVSGEHDPLCDAVVARLVGAPGNLSAELGQNPLYAQQGILDEGFGLRPLTELLPLRAFTLRGPISRKTLLPRATADP